MESEESNTTKPGALSMEINDKDTLYEAYMPFIDNGGLFIRVQSDTLVNYQVGDALMVLLRLRMDEVDERLPVSGHIVWITPPGAQGFRDSGVGVQFSGKHSETTQQRIETILAGTLNSDKPTNTL